MQIDSNSFYDIGSNYTIKLNDKEMLVVEEDTLRSTRLTQSEKLNKKAEKELEKKELGETQESGATNELSEDEERLVRDLATRDSEVRAHESAHQAAGGGMVGAASYTYQQGPDGKMYAIGGEVSVSMKAGSTPEETIANAKQLAAAAMAAGDPSPQDHAVAASARVMEMKAQQQLANEEKEEILGKKTYADEASKTDSHKQKEESLDLLV
jgi:hypothetical protein